MNVRFDFNYGRKKLKKGGLYAGERKIGNLCPNGQLY